MAIFVVASTSEETIPKLAEAVRHEIAEADRIQINSATWLVEFPGDSVDVAVKIGIKKGGIPGMVTSAPDIVGLGPKPLADWMR